MLTVILVCTSGRGPFGGWGSQFGSIEYSTKDMGEVSSVHPSQLTPGICLPVWVKG
jgi:hypothetical protein